MIKHSNIKKMNRKELLELLLLQSRKIDELECELSKKQELLNSKEILLKESGSIAEASLRLNKVFEAAQLAANQYLDNVKKISKNNRN